MHFSSAGYYQWVPVVLALQALLFFLPIVFWRNVNEGTGIKVQAICDTALSDANIDAAARTKSMTQVGRFMALRAYCSDTLHGDGRFSGRYVVCTYLVTKILFTANAVSTDVSDVFVFRYLLNFQLGTLQVLQFFAMTAFLGLKGVGWGWDLLSTDWHVSGNFPRITLCDFQVCARSILNMVLEAIFQVRELGNLHRHTVQCTLIINMSVKAISLNSISHAVQVQ